MAPPKIKKTLFSFIGITAVTAITVKLFYYGCFVSHASTSQLISVHMISRHGARTRMYTCQRKLLTYLKFELF